MIRWLKILFTRSRIRIAPAWETPPEIRTKLRCAIAGIEPDTVQKPHVDKADALPRGWIE
jgi:hypothetical protein